ncbi:Conserved_hypothetical protein [Hexamita inflata]|uniref:Uncharacterized protein n=1 Tax=Hexamita inflata TaxID=28002 RepID=A0AA86U0U0_9EUKA|nr:Conserved hypothetical protein [Hexamita inflata]
MEQIKQLQIENAELKSTAPLQQSQLDDDKKTQLLQKARNTLKQLSSENEQLKIEISQIKLQNVTHPNYEKLLFDYQSITRQNQQLKEQLAEKDLSLFKSQQFTHNPEQKLTDLISQYTQQIQIMAEKNRVLEETKQPQYSSPNNNFEVLDLKNCLHKAECEIQRLREVEIENIRITTENSQLYNQTREFKRQVEEMQNNDIGLQKELQQSNKLMQEIQPRLDQAENRVHQLQDEIQQLLRTNSDLTKDYSKSQQDFIQLQNQVEINSKSTEKQISAVQEDLKLSNQQRQQLNQQISQLQDENQQLRNQISVNVSNTQILEQQLRNSEQNTNNVENRVKELNIQTSLQNQQIQDNQTQFEHTIREKQDLQVQLQTVQEKYLQMNTQYQKQLGMNEENKQTINDLELALREKLSELSQLKQLLDQSVVQVQSSTEEIQNLKKKLQTVKADSSDNQTALEQSRLLVEQLQQSFGVQIQEKNQIIVKQSDEQVQLLAQIRQITRLFGEMGSIIDVEDSQQQKPTEFVQKLLFKLRQFKEEQQNKMDVNTELVAQLKYDIQILQQKLNEQQQIENLSQSQVDALNNQINQKDIQIATLCKELNALSEQREVEKRETLKNEEHKKQLRKFVEDCKRRIDVYEQNNFEFTQTLKRKEAEVENEVERVRMEWKQKVASFCERAISLLRTGGKEQIANEILLLAEGM